MKICTVCKIEKPYDDFGPHRNRNDGRQTYCKQCAKDKQTEWHYRRKYGITLAERDALLFNQGGMCAICEKHIEWKDGKRNIGDEAVIDHCHGEGHIRGVLCGHCNTGLGAFKDDPANLANAFQYLQNTGEK